MKRIPIVLMIVLMLSMVAFVPSALTSANELQKARPTPHKPTRTPTPLPTATSAPVQLTAPTLLSPHYGATVGGQVTMKWSAVPGAARYHLQAGLNTYFDGQFNIIEQWSLTDTSYTFTASPGFVEYFPHLYWRVQAIDSNNVQGLWSEIGYFELMVITTPTPTATPIPASELLPAPILMSPPNGTIAVVGGDVTFQWSAVPGAARYHLQAGLTPNFDGQSNAFEIWDLRDTSFMFTVTPDFAYYYPHLYWRVQAFNANDIGGLWSEAWYLEFTSSTP